MKILISYYSRSGNTKKIAEKLAESLPAGTDIERIDDNKKRWGPIGFIISGFEAQGKKMPKIKDAKFDPSNYDLVIIGTPIWAGLVSSPVRTYLDKYKGSFKKVAYYCTYGSTGEEKAFNSMEEVSGKKPVATMAITAKEMGEGSYMSRINKFVEEISAK